MKIVPDASVAVKWVTEESDSATADLLITDANELHAPRLLAAESPTLCGARYAKA